MNISGSTSRLPVFACLLFLLLPGICLSQSSTKQAGIGFRIDENPSVQRIHSYDSLFSIYGQKYSFAVTTYVLPLVPQYVDTLRAMALRGIELMDNTPTHATQFFNVLSLQELNQYINKPGVDHFTGQKVCLKYVSYDTTTPHGEGNINLYGNKVISLNPGEFHDLLGPSQYFALYLKAPVNKICLFNNVQSVNITDPDTLYVNTFWDESFTSPTHLNFKYHKMINDNVVMHDSAVKILAQRSLSIFDSVHLSRPYTWIQPDGQYPWINPLKLKAILGDKLNYKQSTSNIDPSLFCYNEFNPHKNKQFAINSELLNMETGTFKANAAVIANAIAKHYVLFDAARLANSSGGFNAYLQRMDSLLAWCSASNIPIRTYSQWKSILYDSVPQKIINTFPRLDVDLDQDNWPDGFSQTGVEFDQTDGVEASGYKCFKLDSIYSSAQLCLVTQLAGLEKGGNVLTVWTKGLGNPLSVIECYMYSPDCPSFNLNLHIPSDSSDWVKHTFIITLPDSLNTLTFSFLGNTAVNDIVKISGMSFRSSGFLSQSTYPLQVQTANALFPNINLNSLVLDTMAYPPSSITWSFKGAHKMWFTVDSLGYMHSNRPTSFWTGKDSVFAIARRPDNLTDSCFFRFKSDTIPSSCAGIPIQISIMDTITSNDYIVWTSVPYDSTMSDTTIFNPTVSPGKTTWYKVKVYNLLGNIYKDSIRIKRYPFPVPGLFHDSTICQGRTINLTAKGGGTYLWNTGDTTASISVKPDTLTTYSVTVTGSGNCSATDSTIITVAKTPVVTMSGLLPQYCATDPFSNMSGVPWNGLFGGSSGVQNTQFYPDRARLGSDTVWFAYTSPEGCFNADTMYTFVTQPPVIPPLPDTNLVARNSIVLHAGEGADNYLWSTGDTTEYTVVDSLHHGLGLLKVWVYVTKGSCVAKDTARINFIPSGINGLDPLSFSVFPNPFQDKITIILKYQPGQGEKAELISLEGKILYSEIIRNKETNLSLKNVSSGIYLLKLTHNDATYYMKMVKD